MPLHESASKKAVSANIRAELKAGKLRSQAIAIALETARRATGTGKPRTNATRR